MSDEFVIRGNRDPKHPKSTGAGVRQEMMACHNQFWRQGLLRATRRYQCIFLIESVVKRKETLFSSLEEKTSPFPPRLLSGGKRFKSQRKR